MGCTCTNPAPLVRQSMMPGVPADKALQISVRCPGCGACQQVAGFTALSDEQLRPGLWNPPPPPSSATI
jgi:MinD superfamily P-loop ATPase